MKQPSIKKNIILNTIYSGLCAITPLITAPYTARVLGAEALGLNSFVSSISTYFAAFIALGTSVYGAVETSKARDDKKQLSRTFWGIEAITAFTFLIALIAWIAFVEIFDEYKLISIIYICELAAILFDITWLFRGIEQLNFTVPLNCIAHIVKITLILVLVKEPADLPIFVLIVSGGTLLTNMLCWASLPKYVSFVRIKFSDLIMHLKKTIIFFVPVIARTLYGALDKTLLGLLGTGFSENGYYSQANSIVSMVVSFCFIGFITTIAYRTPYLFKQEKYDEMKANIRVSIDYIAFLGIGAIFGIAAIANHFVLWFFGSGFERTGTILVALAPMVVLSSLTTCLGGLYYNAVGLTKKNTKYIIIGVTANLILNLCLISSFKGVGAAVASVIAELLTCSLCIVFSNGFCSPKMVWSCMWKKIVAGAIMFAIVFPIGKFINDHLISFVIQVVIGICLYIAVLYLMNDRKVLSLFISETVGRLRSKNKSNQ